MNTLSPLQRLWDLGQSHLGLGRYISARTLLEEAERIAWRVRDARALARLYLPLLETRRQIRYLAVEGPIWVSGASANDQEILRNLRAEKTPAATVLLASRHAPTLARKITGLSINLAAAIETLHVVAPGRVAAFSDPTIAGSITLPLPSPGRHQPGSKPHALLREHLLLGWEALALLYQSRHAPASRELTNPWVEMAWLRNTLRIDPACEPVSMRLMQLAESIAAREP